VRQPTFLAYLTTINEQHLKWASDVERSAVVTGPIPNAWFAPKAGRLGTDDASFDRFLASVDPRAGLPIVVHERDVPDVVAFDEVEPAQRIALQTTRYTPNHLHFAFTAPSDGWLLVTDRWARGWSAQVDGMPHELSRGCFLVRAIHVTAGRHEVAFIYQPFGYPRSVAMSWSLLAIVALSTVAQQVRRAMRTKNQA
jgi:hypothetical protein